MRQGGAATLKPAPDDVRLGEAQFADVNLDRAERQFSVVSGALFVLAGMRRRSFKMLVGGGFLLYRGVTGYCPVYRALEKLVGAPLSEGLVLEESIAVNKPVEEAYALWRQIENLPRFMVHVESVTPTYGNRSHWVARLPEPIRLEWDAAITDDQPNKKISWCSLPGSRIHHSGSVFFHPLRGHGGTEIKIILNYKPPAGSAGTAAARLLSLLTRNQIRTDLRSFKAIAETGERPTTEGQPCGRVAPGDGAIA
jgi:uncharacterized membrane protein